MIRFLTAGESHGPMLSAIVEGIPAGLPLQPEDIDRELRRRQKGYGSSKRMDIEHDRVRMVAGVMKGKTTGGPISLLVENLDFVNWQDKQPKPMTIPRPGHADLTGALKYGYDDLRLALERSSARETAMRVAVGAICRCLLSRFNITIGGYVCQIGSVKIPARRPGNLEDFFLRAEESPVRCPIPKYSDRMLQEIQEASASKDTLGGVFEIAALHVPPGLGSYVHYDRRLDGRLVGALVSIPGIKGAEIGPAFVNAGKRGSEVHDAILLANEAGQLGRGSNRAGGTEGGISTGEPILVRAAMKPISTLLCGMPSVNLATGQPAMTTYERSDICAVPRAVVVGEAMVAIVLAEVLMEKLGGDSLDEMAGRFRNLRQGNVHDWPGAV